MSTAPARIRDMYMRRMFHAQAVWSAAHVQKAAAIAAGKSLGRGGFKKALQRRAGTARGVSFDALELFLIGWNESARIDEVYPNPTLCCVRDPR